MANKEQKKDIVICPKGFFFGNALAEELTTLRRYIMDLASTSDSQNSASELAERLFVLNYLIEDVGYVWDTDNKFQV